VPASVSGLIPGHAQSWHDGRRRAPDPAFRAAQFASLFFPFFFLTSLLCCMRRVHHTEPGSCPAIEKETLS